MTQDSFTGAVLILLHADNASEIADRIASGYWPDSAYHYKVTESIPDNVPTAIADQAGAKLRDSPEGAVVLTVYPFAELSVQ